MLRITVLLKKNQLGVFYAEVINYIWNKMCELPLTFQGLYLLITEPWQIEIIYKLDWNGNPILFLVLLNNSIKELFIYNMYAIFPLETLQWCYIWNLKLVILMVVLSVQPWTRWGGGGK